MEEDWICLTCDVSFFNDEENGVERKWVQCSKCQSISHINCISQLQFDLDEDDKYLCPECFFTEPNADITLD